MKICVYGAASNLIDEKYKEAGKELGRKMVERGHELVFGGGNNGMMGSVAEGVYEKSGHILGVIPEFFKEGGEEVSFKHCSEYIYTDTVRNRKKAMEDNAEAFIITPGGIGTLDEFFEILTLKQLGRHNKALVIYNIDGFFDSLDKMMDYAIKEKFVTDDCKELYEVCNNIQDVLEYIEKYDPKDIDINKVKIR